MNPPFSLEDWGHDTVAAGDKYGRLGFGMPPASNGDWAWLQQIAKSLKDADPDTGIGGQGMVVMSQGVLFRGQPEQTEEEDGQNQKADAEYVIRRGFIEADLIEAIVVLPGKLFYGNNVPGCLLLLNKAKPEARKGKILMIWASRHFQKGNPQNLLRPSDLMRVLVPWQAFGDLEAARALVPVHEAQLIREVEQDRDSRLADIEDAYGPVLEPLARLQAELATLEALDLKVQAVRDAISPEHPYFHPLAPLKAEVDRIEAEIAAAGRGDKGALKAALLTSKAKFDVARKQLVDAIKAREKQVARAVKELVKLQQERDASEAAIARLAEAEVMHLREAVVEAKLQETVSAVRRTMLSDSFSFLPVQLEGGHWSLISDAAVVRFLRQHHDTCSRAERLAMPLDAALGGDGLKGAAGSALEPIHLIDAAAYVTEQAEVDSVLDRIDERPVLVTSDGKPSGRLVGILTSFDLL